VPRFAGPIAQFLCDQPQATRWDLLDFIRRTWGVDVSRMALHRFLKKYGLDQASRVAPRPTPSPADAAAPADGPAPEETSPGEARPQGAGSAVVLSAAASPSGPLPAADFFLPPPSTPAPSCSCPRPSTGWPSPATA